MLTYLFSGPNSKRESVMTSTASIITITLLFVIIGLGIALAITLYQKAPEVGTVFRNALYGLYYMGDQRIDDNVAEVIDENPTYNSHSGNIKSVIHDKNPQYAAIIDDDGYARITTESSPAAHFSKAMAVDAEGYARIITVTND